jgi:hypothetical protein
VVYDGSRLEINKSPEGIWFPRLIFKTFPMIPKVGDRLIAKVSHPRSIRMIRKGDLVTITTISQDGERFGFKEDPDNHPNWFMTRWEEVFEYAKSDEFKDLYLKLSS